MSRIELEEESLRRVLKEVVLEALDERRELFRELLAEVVEEIGLAEAIREGRQSEAVSRKEVFATLRDKS